MLQNELYTFTGILTEGNVVKANVKLDPSHSIFKGHFPGEPVLPGVCMTQMVKDLLEIHTQKKMRLVRAHDIKFLSVIVPEQNKLIPIELKLNTLEEGIRAEARLMDGADTLFKFKGIFQ
jgi:3-hydroxyacyl-[acyl-carrier-protein] dehydratase